MGGQCCNAPRSIEEQLLNEFWNIKLRTRSHKDLIEYIEIKEFSETNISNPKGYESLVKEFLVGLNPKFNQFYINYWQRVYSEPKTQEHLYYLFLSLLLLCVNSKLQFSICIKKLNNLFPTSSQALKLEDFLEFYINIITNACLKEVCELNELDLEQSSRMAKLFQKEYIDAHIRELLKWRNSEKESWCFIEDNYLMLNDDVLLRDQLLLKKEGAK